MVRNDGDFFSGSLSFPHSRGDGPEGTLQLGFSALFSPLAWGWSEQENDTTNSGGVFPTRVGMVRVTTVVLKPTIRFPHSRGDGPISECPWHHGWKFSPLAWGWSAITPVLLWVDVVFPTRVGMVRWPATAKSSPSSFPHSRGDGPMRGQFRQSNIPFSPLAWGWSARMVGISDMTFVFPTRVGMVRDARLGKGDTVSFPHSRGDGPASRFPQSVRTSFSPLAWGWSEGPGECRDSSGVFPTRVGMVRCCG